MEEQLREKERQLLQKEGNWHWRQQYQNDILNLYQRATIVLIIDCTKLLSKKNKKNIFYNYFTRKLHLSQILKECNRHTDKCLQKWSQNILKGLFSEEL